MLARLSQASWPHPTHSGFSALAMLAGEKGSVCANPRITSIWFSGWIETLDSRRTKRQIPDMRDRGRKAWLVTWEHIGDHAQPERKIAAVLEPQLSGRRVRELVEFLYASVEYQPFEQLEIAFGLRSNPYPGTFGSMKDGPAGLWEGEVNCGHNPWLYARLVDNLIIPADGEPTWQEPPRPHNNAT